MNMTLFFILFIIYYNVFTLHTKLLNGLEFDLITQFHVMLLNLS